MDHASFEAALPQAYMHIILIALAVSLPVMNLRLAGLLPRR